MKNKHSRKGRVLLSAAIALAVLVTSGAVLWKTTATADSLTNLGGFLSYDASKVTVTEGYSAVVGASTVTTSTGGLMKNSIIRLGSMNRQLDNGQNGLLVQSVKSGTEAEGAGVNFTNTLTGDFSMDFRVFSQETFQGFYVTNPKTNSYTDEYNSFLDAKQVGITITSVSDPNAAFTIKVNGSKADNTVLPMASVEIAGETYKNGEEVGYGIEYHSTYGELISTNYNTPLFGTSFCNVSNQEYNAPTSISVDMKTLKVYGVSSKMTSVSGTAAITTENVLIRDLQNNTTSAGESLYQTGMEALDPAAFANGYTVSVAFTDITDNATVVKKPAWTDGGGEVWGNATGTALTDSDGADLVYDRYAKMIIYSLNGQSFQKTAGFKVDTNTNIYGTAPYGSGQGGEAWTGDVLRLHTQSSGLAAEGTSFTYAGTKTGTFEQEFAVYTWENHAKTWTSSFSKYNGGNGVEDDENLQPTIRQIAFEFVSNSNPEAKFTLFVRSHGSGDNYLKPQAYVAVPGDKIYTKEFEQGYGLSSGAFDPNKQTLINGGFKGTSYNSDFNVSKIKFDATAMKVYGMVESEYALIRDLATNSGTDVPKDYCASLNVSDWSEGYKVTFTITDVTRNGVGQWTNIDPTQVAKDLSTGRVYNKNGTLTAEPDWAPVYDLTKDDAETRVPDIWFAGLTTSDIEGFNTSTTATYAKQQPTAKIATMELEAENELKPVFFGVMSNDATVSGDITFANGDHTGTITATEGVYKFTPTTEGEYTFTYNVSWNGETIVYTTKAMVIDVYGKIIFQNGDESSEETVENGKQITLSTIAPTVSKVGYQFVGWTDGANTYTANDSFTPNGTVTLTAVFSYGDIQGATITLGGALGVNFYVELPETATTETATFTVGNDVVKTVTISEMEKSGNVYKFTYEVAPKDFRTEITLTVDDESTKTYSAEAYLNTVMNDTTGDFNANDKAIAVATYNYCAIASKYFDGVATTVTVEEVAGTDLAAYAHEITLNLPDGVTALGPRLVLESETEIRFYFSSDVDLSSLSCTVNGETATIESRTDGGVTVYYVAVENIAAKDLDKMQDIKIGTDGEYASISYSALSYVRSALLAENTSAELKEIVCALYQYSVAADAYFGQNN